MRTKKEQTGRQPMFTLGLSIPSYVESYKDKRKATAQQRLRIEKQLTNYELQEYILEYDA